MMKKYLFALLFITTCFYTYAQVITPFSIRYQTTQKGGIRFLSNTSVSCNGGAGCGTARAEVPPAGTGYDNNFTEAYVDVDADATTFQSSSDSLALATCSQILWAGLYWGGEMTNAAADYSTRNQCKIKVNNGAYTALTATSLQDNATGFNTYHCFKDITTIVQAAGINARFTVANVACRVGGTNRFGGWTIVVVYKNDLQPMRNLTVFNGLSNVSSANPTTPVTVNGFLTPSSGPITFEVGAVTYDGDRSLTGDQLIFNGVNISDAANNSTDIFNSTLCYNGVPKTAPFINPAYQNTLGYDADIFIPNNTTKNYIGNSATSATLQLTTATSGGETYLTQVVTMAIDVYEPDLRAAVRAVDINGGVVQPGDTVEYTVVGKNIGSDPSTNTYIVDTLERNAIFVPGSIKITYGPNSGSKTDATADDQGEYISASKVVKVRIGTGANGTNGGVVNNSTLGTDSTQFKFRVVATTDCIILSCDNIINNQAYIYGTGNISGNTFNNGSNPGIFDALGCPISGTTATPINAATCTPPTASSNSPVCAGSTINLTSVSSSAAGYQWNGPNAFTSTLSSPSITNATAAMAGTYSLVISVTGTTCTYSTTTTVVVNAQPTTANAGPDQTICRTTGSATMAGNTAAVGTGAWTQVSGPVTATITTPASPTTTITGMTTAGTYVFQWRITNGSCTPSSDQISVFVNAPPTTSNAGPDQTICAATATLAGNTAAAGTGTWTQVSGPVTATITTPSSPTSTLSGMTTNGTYVFQWTITNAPCTASSDQVSIIRNATPTTSNAGPDQTICTTGGSATMAGNTAAVGTGAWTQVSGPVTATITTPASPTTTITGMTTAGTYVFQWTISNAPCTASSDQISVISNSPPTAANAGPDQSICAATATLAGNTAAAGTGTWTQVSGPVTATITTPSSPTSTLSGMTTNGTYVFQWTITNAPCTASSDQVSIIRNATPTTSNAGPDQTICTTGGSATMAGNTAAVGTGAWTQVSGPVTATITTPASPTTTITGMTTAGTYVFQWSITNGSCTASTDQISVIANAPPTAANAGPDQTVCAATATMAANTAASGTGTWTQVSGPATGTITSANSATTTITGLTANGTYVFQWTITNAPCTASSDQVSIIRNAAPTTANAGPDQTICRTTGSATMAGNTAAVGAGAWTQISGPVTATITTPASPTTTITGMTTAGTYVYQWSITNAPCAASTDQISVIVNAPPTTSNAGPDQTVCAATATLAGNTATTGTGTWTQVSGPVTATINTPSSPTSTLSGLTANGTYVFQWTITNAPCTASSDQVSVIRNSAPTTSNAGPDQTICTTSGSATMAGNTATVGTGAWTQVSGPVTATITTPASPTTTITGMTTAGTYVYQWAITNAPCAASTDQISVIVNAPPAAPVAGSNSPVCTGQPINLTASFTSGVTYSWTGPNTFNSSSQNPTLTNATTLMAGTYSVTAAIGSCVSTVATVGVVVNTTPAAPVASGNSPVCITYPINLSASTVGSSSYNWSGPGSYTSNQQNPVIANATTAMSGTYSVTATENGCTSTAGTVLIAVVSCSPVANVDTASVNEDGTVTVPVLNNDTDPQNNINTGSVTVTQTPAHGTATIGAGGTVIYTPATNFNGIDTLIYQVCDNTSPTPFCDTALVIVTVNPVNDAPVLDNDIAVTNEDTPVSGDVTGAGDGDPDGTTLTAATTPVNGPAHGSIVINPDGTYTYTPAPNYNGSDTVVIQVCDAGIPMPASCGNDTLFITVIPVNDMPVVNDSTITISEDTTVTICLPIMDADNGQSYSVTSCGNPANGTSSASISGGQVCITYSPNTNFNGADSLCVLVCDNGSPAACDTAIIHITVTPANDPPVVPDSTVSVTEDSTVTVCLPITDPDNGQSYSVTSCGNPANGTSSASISGGQVCITYTPNPNFNGMDSLCVLVCDNGSPATCDTAIIHISVTPVNDPPVVPDSTVTVNEDTPVTVCLPISDNDNGQSYSVASCGNPANGTSSASISGGQVCITYTPNPNFNGADSLCVLVCDNGSPAACDTAIIHINVTPVNDPPVLDNDTAYTFGGTPVNGDVTGAGDNDPDGTPLTVSTTPVSGPANGNIIINGDGTYVYTPNGGFAGTDTIVVSVCDAGNPLPQQCSNDTIFVFVGPMIGNETASTTATVPVSGNMNSNETPATGFAYTTTPLDAPNNGTIAINANGTFTYTPAAGFSGYDTAIVTLCYNGFTPALCSSDTIFITVYPNIGNETISVTAGNSSSGNMNGNDTGTGLSYGTTPVNGPNNGTIVINSNGTYTYTPNNGYTGPDLVVVPVCDASVPPLCSTDTIFINVITGPVVVNEQVSGETGTPISGNILGNDSPTGATVGTVIDNTNNGTTTINTSTGGFVYTPNTGFSGYDTLIVNVCFNGICTPDTVFITVNPNIGNETISVTAGNSTSGSMTGNDSGTGLTYGTTPVNGPDNGTIVINANGTYTYTPNSGYTGSDTVVVTVCDASVPPLCSTDTIFINVISGPVVVNEQVSGETGTPISGNILGNDSPTGATVGTVIDNTNNGTTTINTSTGGFVYTPNNGFSGYDTLIVNVCFNGACTPDTVFITVYPGVGNETISVTSGGSYTGSMTGNDSGTGLTYGTTPVNGPNNGTIVINANGTYTYTPNAGYTGADTVIVNVCDASVPPLCSNDTIFINVTSGPVVVNEQVSGETGTPISGNILGNDSPTGATVGTVIDNTNNGTITINASTGGFVYTPNTGFSGYDTLIINVCFNGVCTPDTVFITVYPSIGNETFTVTSGSSYSGSMTGNDSGTGLTYGTTPVNGPDNGTIVINANGTYTYTPNSGYTGADTVIVTVCDASVPPLCSTDTIFINVISGPVVINEQVSGVTGNPINGNILGNDLPNGATVGTVIDNTNNGTTTINASTGTFVYTPNAGFSGYDTLIVNVCFNGVCNPDTVFITVYPNLDNDNAASNDGGHTYTGNVLGNDSGTSLTADPVPATPPAHGTVTIGANGDYTYTPDPAYCGPDSFAYQACDNSVPKLCSTAWVYISVSCDSVVTDLSFPEGFSPNGDGINDQYIIRGIENYPNNTFTIFNRWGNKVFAAKPYANTWDGTSQFGIVIGTNQLPAGTYFYILDRGDGSKVIKGYIYLNR